MLSGIAGQVAGHIISGAATAAGTKVVNILFEQAGVPPPPRAPIEDYDFVIDAGAVCSIANEGWHIYRSEAASRLIDHSAKLSSEDHPQVSTVATLGYYSKGKTYVVNGLYNVGRRTQRFIGGVAVPWSSASNGTPEKEFAQGDDVTTLGFSGVFTSYSQGEDLTKARVLLLDTAGRNAPADRKSAWSVSQLKESISEIRSKERLIDDITIDISDTILYVVDEVVHEDQRMIMQIVERLQSNKMQGRSQRLIVVHNWKRLKRSEPEKVKSMVETQIVQPFNAKSRQVVDAQDVSLYGAEFEFWESEWKYPSDRNMIVNHFMLLDKVTCADKNDAVFRYIMALSKTNEGDKIKPISKIQNSLSANILRYVHEVDIPPIQPVPTGTAYTDMPTVLKLKIKLADGKGFALNQWAEWEMPRPKSSGDIIPTCTHLKSPDGTSSGPSLDYISVDLPGFDDTNLFFRDQTPTDQNNFVQFFGNLIDDQYVYVVRGRRSVPEDERAFPIPVRSGEEERYGSFHLEFNVSTIFSPPEPADITIKNSVLRIISRSKGVKF